MFGYLNFRTANMTANMIAAITTQTIPPIRKLVPAPRCAMGVVLHDQWRYDLVSQVQPGDRVLHWNSGRSPALLGWSEATGLFAHLPDDGPEALVEDLKELLPDVLDPYAIAAAEYTLEWYADLAPDAAYRPVMPPPENADGIGGVIPAARLASSIGWAVNTATADALAVDKLSGSLDRMVHDSSRR